MQKLLLRYCFIKLVITKVIDIVRNFRKLKQLFMNGFYFHNNDSTRGQYPWPKIQCTITLTINMLLMNVNFNYTNSMPKMPNCWLSNSIIQLSMAATGRAADSIMAGNSTKFCCIIFKFTFSLGIHIDEMK